ncbi:MAG: hypothetical protein RLY37_772 [Verrucomicrobiota bacterium]
MLAAGTLFGAFAWALTGLGGDRSGLLVGVSAGVYALMLVALLDKLDHQITLLLFFFLPVTLKVRWLLIVISLFTFLGWAFAEHLGGLLLGWLAWRHFQRTNAGPSYAQIQEPMETEAPSPSFETPPEVNTLSRPLSAAQARAEMDALLDKISAGGFGSLTPAEKRRLEELSARLR